MLFHYRIQSSCKKGSLAEIAECLTSLLKTTPNPELELWQPQWSQWRPWYKYYPLVSLLPQTSIPQKYFYSGPLGSLCTGLEEIRALILLNPHQKHMIWKPTWPKWLDWYFEPSLASDLADLVPQHSAGHPKLGTSINKLLSQQRLIDNDGIEYIHKQIEARIHQRIDSSKIEHTALFFWKTVLYSTLNELKQEDTKLLNMSSSRFNLPKFCSFFEHNQLIKVQISSSLKRQLESESPIQYHGEKHIIRNCRIWKKIAKSSPKVKLSVRRRFALLFHKKTEFPLPLCVLLLQAYEHYLITSLVQKGTVPLEQLGSIEIKKGRARKHLHWNNSAELAHIFQNRTL